MRLYCDHVAAPILSAVLYESTFATDVVASYAPPRELALLRESKMREQKLASSQAVRMDQIFAQMGDGAGPDAKQLNLMIKADVQGSAEALAEALRAKDINALIDDMYKLVMPPGEEIIHVLPQEYIVDNEQGIIDPIGMMGVRLEANFHIITGQINAAKNIKVCVDKAGLQVKDIILEPIASAQG